MSGSVNKVILVGNLGADPEIRRTQDGRPIANLRIATSQSWRDQATGERRERTEWHRVVVFTEGLAKICEQYLKKGMKVYLEGQLQTREWDDNAGTKRYTTEIVLASFNATLTMLDSQRNGPPPASSPEEYGRPSGRGATGGGNAYRNAKDGEGGRGGGFGAPSTGGGAGDMDDEIPF
jgi:single-strand DNA-binding protein